MFFVITCTDRTECGYTTWSTRESIRCPKCGNAAVCETVADREKRLGITKKDIHSWEVKDELKGTIYETAKEINEETEGTCSRERIGSGKLDAAG